MRYWFTSDTHFGHENIIKYCKRPFKSLFQMDTTMIDRWNRRVKKHDIVFHLGDFCFRNTMGRGEGTIHKSLHYRNQLNGQIILVGGNHDENNTSKSCIRGMYIKLGGYKIYLTHRPEEYSVWCDFNLVGHVHNTWKHNVYVEETRPCLLINVGVDVWDFKPISIEEIIKYIAKIKKEGVCK